MVESLAKPDAELLSEPERLDEQPVRASAAAAATATVASAILRIAFLFLCVLMVQGG